MTRGNGTLRQEREKPHGRGQRLGPFTGAALLLWLTGVATAAAQVSEQISAGTSGQGGSGLIGSLLGTWVLDDLESDDLEEKLSELSASRPGGGFGRNNRPPIGSRGRVGRPGLTGNPALGSDQEEVERLARAADVLRLDLSGDTLMIVDGNRDTRLVFPDGRQLSDGLGGHSAAFLEGAKLVIETRSERRQRIETVTRVGERMHWQTTLQGGRMPEVSYSMVYDRVASPDKTQSASARVPLPEVDGAATVSAAQGDRPVAVERARVSKTVDQPDPATAPATASVIRLLPPKKRANQILTGGVLMQTLTIDPQILIVEFFLDGERVAKKSLPPYEAKVDLEAPAREQVVEVRALGLRDQLLGTDRLILNRLDPTFRVNIQGIDKTASVAAVQARVSVPRKAELDRVEVYLGEDIVETVQGLKLDSARHDTELEVSVPISSSGPNDYVKVVAHLIDGRQLEDVELLQSGAFSEEVDVQLVQLQVLVTDKAGNPVTDLVASDFEVRDGGELRQVERLYPSRDLALVLGMAIDSSGSMGPIWEQTSLAAQRFLDGTLTVKDRAFLVDFDTRLRLLQGLTGDKERLARSLGRLYPEGGTALYDSILFSLLQFEQEPGRRALVVFTDGFDSESRADPTRAIEFGKRLGVPIYAIAMDQRGGRMLGPGMRPGSRPGTPGNSTGGLGGGPGSFERQLRNNLRLITDPTGGRLFQVSSVAGIEQVFDQIQRELRSQYILTYYTDQPRGSEIDPKLKLQKKKGLEVRMAVQSE